MTFTLIWSVCGMLAFGVTLATFQNSFPQFAYQHRSVDVAFSGFVAFFGPCGLLSVLLLNVATKNKLRLRFAPLSAEESWQAHRSAYPHLSCEYWLGEKD